MLMRNSKLIKLICLILSLFVAVSLLGACNNSEPTADNSSAPSDSQDGDNSGSDGENGDEEFTDDPSGDDWSELDPEEQGDGEGFGGDDIGDGDDYGDGFDDDYDDGEDYEGDSDNFTEELFVYNSEEPVTKQYRGISASVYRISGFVMDDKYGRNYTDEQKEIELTRLQQSGIRFARQYFRPEHAWDNAANGGKGGWNLGGNGRIKYFWDYCKGLQSKGINVMLSVGWHLAAYSHIDTGSMGSQPYINDLALYPNEFYGESAGFDFSTCKNAEYVRMAKECLRMGHFISEVYKYGKAHGINNITHFLYFTETSYMNTTEPDGPGYMDPAGDSAPEYIHIVKTLQWKLKKEGVYDLVDHIGPNQSREHGDGLVRYMLERGCEDMFDVWTMHFYPQGPDLPLNVYYDLTDPVFQSYLQPLKDYGIFGKVEFWFDEGYCVADNSKNGIDNGWAGLQNCVVGITMQQRGMNNWCLWQIFDQLWTDSVSTSVEAINGIAVCGSCPSLHVSSIPKSQYYATSLYGRYNGWRDGWAYRTNQEDLQFNGSDIHVGSVKLEDGSWTITVVNTGVEACDFTVKFDKAIYQTLYRHKINVSTHISTTAAHLPDADKTYANVKDIFTDTIEGGSVAIYTGVKG